MPCAETLTTDDADDTDFYEVRGVKGEGGKQKFSTATQEQTEQIGRITATHLQACVANGSVIPLRAAERWTRLRKISVRWIQFRQGGFGMCGRLKRRLGGMIVSFLRPGNCRLRNSGDNFSRPFGT